MIAEHNQQPAQPRKKWPLAGVLWIDLLIIIVLVLISVVIVQQVALLVAARMQGLGLDDLRAMSETELLGLLGIRGAFVSTLVQNAIFVAVPLIRVGLIRREPLATIGVAPGNWLINLAVSLGTAVAALILSVAFGAFFVYVLKIEQNQAEQFLALLRPGDVFGQILFAVLTVLVAPIGEETLFRGYVFNAFRQLGGTGGIVAAYVVSAGLFSAVHLMNVSQGQIALVVPIFALGLLLAMATHITKSLIPNIVAHSLFNSFSTAALLVCANTSLPNCPT